MCYIHGKSIFALDSAFLAFQVRRPDCVQSTSYLYVKILIYRPSLLQLYRYEVRLREKQSEFTSRAGLPSPIPSLSPSHDHSSSIKSYFTTRCSLECFRAAQELVALVFKIHGAKAAGAWWYNIFCRTITSHSSLQISLGLTILLSRSDTYIAGMIVILTRYCPSLRNSLGITCIDESWVLCQKILENKGLYGNHGERCLASLRDLRARLERESGE